MNALKAQIDEWQKAQPKQESEPKPKKYPTEKPKELVAGGEIQWQPVNREAAMLLAKAPWWAQPTYEKKIVNPQAAPSPERTLAGDNSMSRTPAAKPKHRKKKSMKGAIGETTIEQPGQSLPRGAGYTSEAGLKVHIVNGQEMFDMNDVREVICQEVAKLPKETRPNVKAAEDARKIITELTEGIGGEMEKFRADTKRYLEDIRSTRFAMVTETAQMTGQLKEVRQFFLGGDYKEEIARLKDFVELCERLQKLKASGFLDNIADTMLRLAQ